jgi:hypothetical protein
MHIRNFHQTIPFFDFVNKWLCFWLFTWLNSSFLFLLMILSTVSLVIGLVSQVLHLTKWIKDV